MILNELKNHNDNQDEVLIFVPNYFRDFESPFNKDVNEEAMEASMPTFFGNGFWSNFFPALTAMKLSKFNMTQ